MLAALIRWLTGGILDRALDTIDKRVAAETDRDRIKAEVIKTYLETRPGFMRAGGFWTLLIWNVIAALHYGSVVIYSIWWCADCAYPKAWTIAALPPPLDTYEGWIIAAGIGALGVVGLKR